MFAGLYFQIFLLLTFVEKHEEKDTETLEKDASLPEVSVTIPCFNEAKTLRGTVLSILALDYPKDKLNIIVIDDGSTDETFAIAEALNKEYPQVKIFRQKNAGKWSALNFGLEQTASELVTCLDADSFLDKHALRRIVRYFEDKETMAVTPAIIVHNPRNILQLIQKAEYHIGIFSKQLLSKMNSLYVTPGPFSVFRRSVFENLGKYKHAHNTEDMEIALRMHTHHYKIVNCPTAYVYTVAPNTIKKLHRQRVRWIYGFIKNCVDYKFIYFNKQYGQIGTFTLPFSFLFIFTSFYILGNVLVDFFRYLMDRFIEIKTVGLSLFFHSLSFDWFFINIGAITIVTYLTVAIMLFFMLKGKKMAEGTMRPGVETLYFIFFYGFIAPFWFSNAVYNAVLSRKTRWR